MKIEFIQNNMLKISPENYLENYALRKWYEDFFREDIENRETGFMIDFLTESKIDYEMNGKA